MANVVTSEALVAEEEAFLSTQKNPYKVHKHTPYQYTAINKVNPPSLAAFYRDVCAVIGPLMPSAVPTLSTDDVAQNGEVFTVADSRAAALLYDADRSAFLYKPKPLSQDAPDPSRFNFDEELWNLVQANLREHTEVYMPINTIPKALDYLSSHVHAVNGFSGKAASVFMTLVAKLLLLRISKNAVQSKLLKGASPILRVAGLVLTRYVGTPEETLRSFVQGGLLSDKDEVTVVGTTTSTVGDLARKLLTEDEVLELWFPIYPPYMVEHIRRALEAGGAGEERKQMRKCLTLLGGFSDIREMAVFMNESAGPAFQPNSMGQFKVETPVVADVDLEAYGVPRAKRPKIASTRIHGEAVEPPKVEKKKAAFAPYL